MNNTKLTSIKQILSKLFFAGISIIVITLVAQQLISGQAFQKGPKIASADTYTDNGDGTGTYRYDDGRCDVLHIDSGQFVRSCDSSSGSGESSNSASGSSNYTPSCNDDVYYEDNGRRIHKHGGYYEPSYGDADSNGCVYAFDDVGQVEQSNPEPQSQGGFEDRGITQTVDNSSSSSSESESESRSRSEASVRNDIVINNSNYQTQSQSVQVPPTQVIYQVIGRSGRETVREVIREVPAATRVVDERVICPQGTTKIINGDSETCVAPGVQSQPQPQPQQVVTAQMPVQQIVYEQQPQVVTVSGDSKVKELPKTGLPIAALGLGSLLPLGLRLRRYAKVKDAVSANFIWEERELSRI